MKKTSSLLKIYGFGPCNHYQKVVIIFTGSYRETGEYDPKPEAVWLKEDGIFIITVAYGTGFLSDGLNAIASLDSWIQLFRL
uniref:VWFA domain-containing protein n=1 Tax=Caenorhabditis tropicalis TaxID=1561998 RepID=A0A1I7TT67_9PELO